MEERTAPDREAQAVEVLVVLFLVVPSMIISLFASRTPAAGFTILAVTTIFRDLALVALVLYFLWRNGEAWQQIGWTSRFVWRELWLGILLFPIVISGSALLGSVLRAFGLSGTSDLTRELLTPNGPPEFALALILIAVVAVAEEAIFRGYLIARLEAVTANTPFAVGFSTFIFALGHGYEGGTGLIVTGMLGLVFAILFVWRRSLVAPVTIHFLNNLVAILVAPLLLAG